MSTAATYEVLFNKCYNEFFNRVFAFEICPKKLVSMAVIAMEIVEPTPIDGASQKSMVIKMLQRFVNMASINEQSKKYYLKQIENGMISAIIEVVIAATKNKVGVNSPVVVKKTGCLP